jgi:hypothetical protein
MKTNIRPASLQARLAGSFALLLLLLPGCATFKELEPDPELSPLEQGYIELKDGNDNFELDQGKKYFVKFPTSLQERFNLVLVTPAKPILRTILTTTFDDGKGAMTPIPDDAASNDSVFVFAIGARSPAFYWVIDEVRQDVVLSMRYRYVPQWRYIFETKFTE